MCGSELKQKKGMVDFFCENDHCPARKIEGLIHYVSRNAMNIDGLGERIMEDFYNYGFIRRISDIYRLNTKREELIELEGFGIKSVDAMLENIEESKKNSLDRLLFALGINGIGAKTAKVLCKHYSNIDELMNATEEELSNIHDIGPILSKNIVTLLELIEICIKLKIYVVCKDEKESGLRKVLNFGHTYAHALETITNYKKYTHGECVIQGILKALDIAFEMNKIDKEYKFTCQDLIKKFNYTQIPEFDKNRIINIMLSDKKTTKDGIIFLLPSEYAKVEEHKFNTETLKELL